MFLNYNYPVVCLYLGQTELVMPAFDQSSWFWTKELIGAFIGALPLLQFVLEHRKDEDIKCIRVIVQNWGVDLWYARFLKVTALYCRPNLFEEFLKQIVHKNDLKLSNSSNDFSLNFKKFTTKTLNFNFTNLSQRWNSRTRTMKKGSEKFSKASKDYKSPMQAWRAVDMKTSTSE